jgi:cytochrome c-type biogenesis protein CcmH
MVTQLQQRLSQQPDDLEGWKLLGRSATILGNYPVARDAFSQAYTRSEGQDPDAMVGYAESLVLNDEREIDGQAADLFEKAITMAPDNTRALWYGGIVAYRRGDLALAQQRWVELQNQDLPPDLRQLVAERLSELEGQQGAPASPQATTARSSVSVSVQLKSELAGQVPAEATLFLIARRGDAGPPLAVVRRPVSSWPIAITMTDADAMMQGTSLASGGPIRLIARISRSGQPVATSGDPYGEASHDFSATNPVTVTIDRIVP